MDGRNVKQIQLLFENCECYELPNYALLNFEAKGYHKSVRIEFCPMPTLCERELYDHMSFEILAEFSKLASANDSGKGELFKRLRKYKDLVAVFVIFDDNVEEGFYCEWSEHNGANTAQREELMKNGNLYIRIDNFK